MLRMHYKPKHNEYGFELVEFSSSEFKSDYSLTDAHTTHDFVIRIVWYDCCATIHAVQFNERIY